MRFQAPDNPDPGRAGKLAPVNRRVIPKALRPIWLGRARPASVLRMTWTVAECQQVAEEQIGDLHARWKHVQAVAATIASYRMVPEHCIGAAWLHDIGYATALVRTGQHSIDGALYLDLLGAPREIVSLVAFHSGAEFEAVERGLLDKLVLFDRPAQEALDLLTLADMTTGPTGLRVSVGERLDEILVRYEPQHAVHRAVTEARSFIEECCVRALAVADLSP